MELKIFKSGIEKHERPIAKNVNEHQGQVDVENNLQENQENLINSNFPEQIENVTDGTVNNPPPMKLFPRISSRIGIFDLF